MASKKELEKSFQSRVEGFEFYVGCLKNFLKIDKPDDEIIAEILADIDNSLKLVKESFIELYKEANNA
jgi:hypothetical protein